jgi:ABC-type antimicrobial peptide transport system permease subunit
MALGAEPWDVIRQVFAQGLVLAVFGIVVGQAGALALGRFLSTLLYEVSPTDGITFLLVAVSALLIATLACYLPARRATATDPMTALRSE